MSGVKISEDATVNIAKILGLPEIQTRVYIAAMGIGISTLGQISQLAGINVLETAQAVQELETQGFLKKLSGIVTLFVPMEPFLRAHMLEFDPGTLLSISETIKSQVGSTKSQLATMFEDVNTKVESAIAQVPIEISESVDWKEDLTKLQEGIQHAIGSMNTALTGFNESKENILQEFKTLESNLDNYIQSSVESTNQMLFEVHDNMSTTAKTTQNNVSSQLKENLEVLTNEIRTLVQSMKNDYINAFNEFKTANEGNTTSVAEFHNKIDSKILKFTQDFSQFHKDRLGTLDDIDTKLNVIDDVLHKSNAILELAKNAHQNLEAATEKLSFLYGDIDGRRVFSKKQETLDAIGIVQRNLEELESTFARRKDEVEGSLRTAQEKMEKEVKGVLRPTISGIMASFDNEFQKLANEFSTEIKEVSNQANQRFENLNELTLKNTEQMMVDNESKAKDAFTQALDKFYNVLDLTSDQFSKNVDEIAKTGGALTTVVDMWRQSQEETFKQAHEASAARIDSILLGLTALETEINTCNEVHKTSGEKFNSVAQKQVEVTHQLKNMAVAKAAASIKEIKEHNYSFLDGLVSDLGQSVSAIIYKMRSAKENLEKIYNASREVQTPGKTQTYPIIGESAVILMMRDMVRRTRNEIEAVMLVPELQTLMLTSKLPTKTRVTLVGNWEKLPEARIRKILESGTVRMRQLTSEKVKLWLLIRDKEEILLAPETDTKDEELVGIVSTCDSLIRLFSEEMSTIKIRDSKDLSL